MVREGGFSLSIVSGGSALRERLIDGYGSVALAQAGSAFAVRVRNANRAIYAVRLFVDGREAEPGFIKKLRGEDDTTFHGWLCHGRDVHEFLFAKTPVDDGSGQQHAHAEGGERRSLGEVSALIYATKRVRIDASSEEEDSDDDVRARRSSDALVPCALPEKQAVKCAPCMCA